MSTNIALYQYYTAHQTQIQTKQTASSLKQDLWQRSKTISLLAIAIICDLAAALVYKVQYAGVGILETPITLLDQAVLVVPTITLAFLVLRVLSQYLSYKETSQELLRAKSLIEESQAMMNEASRRLTLVRDTDPVATPLDPR